MKHRRLSLSEPPNWRLALALVGQRLQRRLQRPLTESEWMALDRSYFGTDHLKQRTMLRQWSKMPVLRVLRLTPLVAALVFLVACSGEATTEAPASSSAALAQPAPTPGCAWEWLPLWDLPAASVCVQACPGSTLAPLAAGSSGACTIETYEAPGAELCDEGQVWRMPADNVVLWSRVGQQGNRFSWRYWGCP